MAETAQVNTILAPSFLDGPGSRMAIFLQGCDLTCAYCHNPETWRACRHCAQCREVCPNHASPRVRAMTVDAVVAWAAPWAPYLDGVTFSGGECTLQWPFLLECLPRLRQELALPVLLDTNGNLEPAVLEALLPVADGFLFDLKALDPTLHRTLTGAGNDRILANLQRAAAAGKLTEVRTVLLPGATDDPATVLALARFVAGLGAPVPLRLSPFRPQGVRGAWGALPPLDPERFTALCDLAGEVLGERLKRSQ